MVAAMVLTSLSCSPVVQSPPASESGIPRECALRNKNNTNQGKKKKGDVEKYAVPFGCWGGLFAGALCQIAAGAQVVLGWR